LRERHDLFLPSIYIPHFMVFDIQGRKWHGPKGTRAASSVITDLDRQHSLCRKIRILSTPSTCELERDDFLEVVQRLQGVLKGERVLRAALPFCPILCSKDQVIVANDFRL